MTDEPLRQQAARCLAAAAVLAVLVVVLIASSAGPAAAHASFTAATPSPGKGLPQAPGEVVLEFTEPLIRPPSQIRILDPGGTDVGKGQTLAVEGDPTAMRRKLALLAPGVYTVKWTTLSPVDGHTIKGSYKFAVGGSTIGDETVAAGPLASEGPLGLAGRFVALVGIGLWVGSAALDGVAARACTPGAARRVLRRAGPPLVAGGATLSLASTALVSSGSLAALGQVALASQSGLLRTGVVAAAAIASVPAVVRRGGDRLLVVAALPAEAFSGHAAANPDPLLAAVSFATHLAAAGVWGYVVAAGALAGRYVKQALGNFMPYAVAAGVVVGLTGLVNAVLMLTGPGELVSTGYGRMVALKSVVLAVIAAQGITHHRARRRGALPGWVRVAVRAEAVTILGAVAVATVLVGFPDPPREQETHRSRAEPDIAVSHFTEQPAVSVPEVTGPYVVGLTVTPPKPGQVTVHLRVLGVESGDGLRNASVRATRPGTEAVEASLDSCGHGCFAGPVTLSGPGRWTVTAHIDSNRHPIKVSAKLPLPTPEGDEIFQRALAAMEQLRTAQVRETLKDSEEGQPITSRYTFQAPDRMRWHVTNGSTRIAVGGTGYIKSTPADPFQSYAWPGDGFSWPDSFYDSFWQDPQAIRVLGTDTLDGVQTTVLSFVQPRYPAWYRLWVSQDTGRIRRLEMRADAHLMDHVYGPYNEPATVEPPTSAQPRA